MLTGDVMSGKIRFQFVAMYVGFNSQAKFQTNQKRAAEFNFSNFNQNGREKIHSEMQENLKCLPFRPFLTHFTFFFCKLFL